LINQAPSETPKADNNASPFVMEAPVTLFLMRTSDNPEGVPGELIEAEHEAIARDFPRWITENHYPRGDCEAPQEQQFACICRGSARVANWASGKINCGYSQVHWLNRQDYTRYLCE
jgi:hypothetical protein